MLTLVRRFSGCSVKRNTLLWKQVEVVKDAQQREYDAFWKAHGSAQTNLKRSDLKKTQEAWGKDHVQTYTFLKDTDTLVALNSHTVFRPLDPNNGSEEFVFMGNFWTSPNVPASTVQNMVKQQAYDAKFAVVNSMMCAKKSDLWWYYDISGSKESVLKHYSSYYDISDFQIPKDLDVSGITLKNARDAPDADILNYDAKVFNYERSKYVLGQVREDFGRVAYNEKGEVIGFGAVAVFPSGECSITPMYADDKRVARAILKSILEEMTLDTKKYWRIQVRSIDYSPDGYGWIRPFIRTQTHRNQSSTLMCDHKLYGVDFSKVFCTFPANNCPI